MTKRKLVSVVKVWNVEPIEGADRVEKVNVLGWTNVAPKGMFHKDDLAIFYEEDSFLPVDDDRYSFLRDSCYKKNEFMGEGLLVRNRKLRGVNSQGLLLPISQFPELADAKVGDIVADKLGVRKWMVAEIQGSGGTMIGDKPGYVPTTDELRLQSELSLLDSLQGLPYYISTKVDGTSMSIWRINGEIGISGRTKRFKNDGKSPMWKLVEKYDLFDKLEKDDWSGIIQAEFAGEKIQKNPLGLFGVDMFVFNVFDSEGNLYTLDDMLAFCEKYGLKTVNIDERGDSFSYTLEELVEKSKGNYNTNNKVREGIVVRPQTPVYNDILKKSLSFKVINPDYPTYRD